jgi:hypothetical protein
LRAIDSNISVFRFGLWFEESVGDVGSVVMISANTALSGSYNYGEVPGP